MLTLLAALARAGVFTGVLLLVGLASFRWVVLERPADAAALRRAAALGLLACTGLALALLAAFAVQLLSFNLPPDPLLPDARLLLTLPWGRVWTAQLALALAGVVTFGVALGGAGTAEGATSVAAWALAALVALALSFTPALSGHAIATEGARALAVGADTVHVIAGGAWLGTLAVIAWTAPRADSAPEAGAGAVAGAGAGAVLLGRVRRFSPVALGCAVAIVGSGVVGSWLHLNRPSDLWTSLYGRLLALKLVVFAGVLAAGWFNWKRATPRLAGGEPEALRSSLRTELALAALLLLVTAVFVATPQPMEG